MNTEKIKSLVEDIETKIRLTEDSIGEQQRLIAELSGKSAPCDSAVEILARLEDKLAHQVKTHERLQRLAGLTGEAVNEESM